MNSSRIDPKLLSGVAAGAGLMYLLDPQTGRRRRALLRDKVVHAGHLTSDALRKSARDTGNRARGLAARSRSAFRRGAVPDDVLAERVRAALGRAVSHPSAIEVTAEDGRVTLSGPILDREVEKLLRTVSKVRGVREVESRLEAHDRPDDVPALQGGGGFGPAQESWPPATRLVVGLGGGALIASCTRRRDAAGTALGTLGFVLLARAVTNLPARRLLGLGAGRRAVDLQKTIHVDAPIEEVFDFWSRLENFPRFMAHVQEVRNLGNRRSHWKVRGPAGSSFEWDAEVTRFEPNEVVAWKSLPGAAVASSGIVHFEREGDDRTRIHVQMSYNPPAGAVGHGIAALLGSDPGKEMDEDLVRFKSLLEDGRTTARGESVERQEL